MKTKLLALSLIAVIALQLTACGKKNDTENIPSLPSETIIETFDTPETPVIPDTTCAPVVHKLSSTDTDSEKSSDTSSASKTESKSSSSAASSKSQGSAASSKATSSKASSSKAAVTQPTTTVTTNNGGNNGNNGNATDVNSQNTVTNIVEPDPEPVQSTPQPTQPVVSYYEPEPTPQPEPEPEPEPTSEPEASPYARPYDLEAIRQDMIDYGLSLGLRLDESLTVDNAGWSVPIGTESYFTTEGLKLGTQHLIYRLVEDSEYLGFTPEQTTFNVQFVPNEIPGEYDIVVPYR